MTLSPTKHHSRHGGPSRLFGWMDAPESTGPDDIFFWIVMATLSSLLFLAISSAIGTAFTINGTIDPGFVAGLVTIAAAIPVSIICLIKRARRVRASKIQLRVPEARSALRSIIDAFKALSLRQRFSAYKTYTAAIDAVYAYDADVVLRDQAISMVRARLQGIHEVEHGRYAPDGFVPAKPGEKGDLENLKATNEIQREFSTSSLVSLGLRFKRATPIPETPILRETLADGRSTISAYLDPVEKIQLITDRADRHTRAATAASA